MRRFGGGEGGGPRKNHRWLFADTRSINNWALLASSGRPVVLLVGVDSVMEGTSGDGRTPPECRPISRLPGPVFFSFFFFYGFQSSHHFYSVVVYELSPAFYRWPFRGRHSWNDSFEASIAVIGCSIELSSTDRSGKRISFRRFISASFDWVVSKVLSSCLEFLQSFASDRRSLHWCDIVLRATKLRNANAMIKLNH